MAIFYCQENNHLFIAHQSDALLEKRLNNPFVQFLKSYISVVIASPIQLK